MNRSTFGRTSLTAVVAIFFLSGVSVASRPPYQSGLNCVKYQYSKCDPYGVFTCQDLSCRNGSFGIGPWGANAMSMEFIKDSNVSMLACMNDNAPVKPCSTYKRWCGDYFYYELNGCVGHHFTKPGYQWDCHQDL